MIRSANRDADRAEKGSLEEGLQSALAAEVTKNAARLYDAAGGASFAGTESLIDVFA